MDMARRIRCSAAVTREIRAQRVRARLVELSLRNEETERLAGHDRIGAIEPGDIEQGCGHNHVRTSSPRPRS